MINKLVAGPVLATGVEGIAGGSVVAFGGGGSRRDEKLLADVSERLGLEPGRPQEAFNQAKREQTDDKVREAVKQLVESGGITQEHADEALEWILARPDTHMRFHFLACMERSCWNPRISLARTVRSSG